MFLIALVAVAVLSGVTAAVAGFGVERFRRVVSTLIGLLGLWLLARAV